MHNKVSELNIFRISFEILNVQITVLVNFIPRSVGGQKFLKNAHTIVLSLPNLLKNIFIKFALDKNY